MKPKTLWYFGRETGYGLWRNGWMTLASVSTVAISLFVLAFFIVLSVNLNHVAGVLESEVEVRVFIHQHVPRTSELRLMNEAKHWPDIRHITFFTKTQAARQLQSEFPDQKDLLQLIDQSNPLFDGYDVYTRQATQIPQVANHFRSKKIVESVVYEGLVAKRIDRVTEVVRAVGWGIEALLALATLSIISNTIRLAVFARRREIGVMKLVGATDWFIRWPFVMEGMVLGLVGAVAADVLVNYGYRWAIGAAVSAMPFWPVAPLSMVLDHTIWVTIATGLVIGALGSLVAVRRFLRV